MEKISNQIYLAAINYNLLISGIWLFDFWKSLKNKDVKKVKLINAILAEAAKENKIKQADRTIINETILQAYRNAIKKEEFFHIIGLENYDWFKRNGISVIKTSSCSIKWPDRLCQNISTYLFFRDYERFSLTINYSSNFIKCNLFPNKNFAMSADFTSNIVQYVKNFFKCT